MIKTRLPERAYLLNLHSILKLKEYQYAIIFPITIAESDLFRSSLQFTGGIFTETVMGIWEAFGKNRNKIFKNPECSLSPAVVLIITGEI